MIVAPQQIQISKEFALTHKDKMRALQKSTDFIRFGTRTISIRGWSIGAFAKLMGSGFRRSFEIIVLDDKNDTAHSIGDTVTINNIFPDSSEVVWENNEISFKMDDGVFVNIDEYAYVQKNGLNGNQFFAIAEKKDGDVQSNFKALTRRAAEARKDKAIQILYLTLGAINWLMEEANGKKGKERVKSPLFLCSIKEDSNSKNTPKFFVNSDKVQINTTLARLVKSQYYIDIYAGCPAEFSVADIERYIDIVENNLAEVPEIVLLKNDMHLCNLDSSNELICQAVERNIDKIAQSSLVAVFSGSVNYQSPYDPAKRSRAIFPLAADDTQRDVVERVTQGESLNCHAGPGTGKSQTIGNIVVNLVVNGRTVCVMSEKAAATEVVADYLKKCGLGSYCLVLTEKVRPKEVISQIKRSIAATNVYVDKEQAEAVVLAYYEAVEEYNKLNSFYENIPELGTNLYSITAEAIAVDDMECGQYFSGQCKYYSKAKRKVNELQTQLLDLMSDEEWQNYLKIGTSGDEEQDELLTECIHKIESYGLDIKQLVLDKDVSKSDMSHIVISQYARYIANIYIDMFDLKTYGNRKLKMLYKKLVESSNAMQEVSSALCKQELAHKIREAVKDSKFVELLDRLATSRISLHDLFTKYGEDIMKLCPIIVATPQMLVNYDSLNKFDTLIVDESSQLPFTSILPFLVGDRQLVIFGDPMQLDLTSYFTRSGIYDQDDGEEFDLSKTDKSILHVAQGKLPGCQLQYHYRSKTEELITVSNEKCYDGLLNVAPDNYTGRENLPANLGYELIEIKDPEINKRGANISEAQEIVERVIKIRTETPEKTIGIIVFNENQQNAVNDEIDRRCNNNATLYSLLDLDGDKIFLRTLDNAQGKEADVVLISIGHYRRNKDGSVDKNMGTLTKEGALNRLNVLFTRAREKVIVTISFSYNELKDSNNPGIYRLYEYLHYMATGECKKTATALTVSSDKLNDRLQGRLESLLTNREVRGKIGHDKLTVDIGIIKPSEPRYDVGILFPNKALSANSVCTKVNVLERAGWHVLPLSPVSFFTKPEVFEKQIIKDLDEKVSYCKTNTESMVTEIRPPELFTLSDMVEEESEAENILPELSMDEFLSEDYDVAYGSIYPHDVAVADGRMLLVMSRNGNSLARLRLATMKLKDYINADRVEDLLKSVQRWYSTDKTYAYLYAQLLRAMPGIKNDTLIRQLLSESEKMGIKIA